jgi:hypothetical protein
MTTKAIRCAECGKTVPSGRLSCPACGALVASVSRPSEPDTVADRPAAAHPIDPVVTVAEIGTDSSPAPLPWPPLELRVVARSYGREAPAGAGARDPIPPTPGAYLPPGLAMSTATAGAADRLPATSAGGAARAGSAVAAAGIGRGALPGIDAVRLVEIAGRLAVAGSAMAVLGFLLPWSVVVIGARGGGGYLDDWGMASPTHVLVLLGLLSVLALGVVRTPVPAWLRTGVLGLGVGGLLIGLIWPYLLGPLGADIGVLVTALGGLALVTGGFVASWATRHVEADPLV